MSIVSKINQIKTDIDNAFTSIKTAGGNDAPAEDRVAGLLADYITTIPSAIGGWNITNGKLIEAQGDEDEEGNPIQVPGQNFGIYRLAGFASYGSSRVTPTWHTMTGTEMCANASQFFKLSNGNYLTIRASYDDTGYYTDLCEVTIKGNRMTEVAYTALLSGLTNKDKVPIIPLENDRFLMLLGKTTDSGQYLTIVKYDVDSHSIVYGTEKKYGTIFEDNNISFAASKKTPGKYYLNYKSKCIVLTADTTSDTPTMVANNVIVNSNIAAYASNIFVVYDEDTDTENVYKILGYTQYGYGKGGFFKMDDQMTKDSTSLYWTVCSQETTYPRCSNQVMACVDDKVYTVEFYKTSTSGDARLAIICYDLSNQTYTLIYKTTADNLYGAISFKNFIKNGDWIVFMDSYSNAQNCFGAFNPVTNEYSISRPNLTLADPSIATATMDVPYCMILDETNPKALIRKADGKFATMKVSPSYAVRLLELGESPNCLIETECFEDPGKVWIFKE